MSKYTPNTLSHPLISRALPQPKSFDVPVFVHQLPGQVLAEQLAAMVAASATAVVAATTIVVNGAPVTVSNLGVRNCYTFPATVEHTGTAELFDSLAKVAWGSFGFHASGPTGGRWQFLMYKPGGFFVPHYDDSRGHIFNGKNYVYRNTPERAMAVLVYLNDDYEGGELEFTNIRDSSGLPLRVKPKAGTVVAFPCHELYAHQVLPVTSGTRYAVSRWFDDAAWLKISPTNFSSLDDLSKSTKLNLVETTSGLGVSNTLIADVWKVLCEQELCHRHVLGAVSIKNMADHQVLSGRDEYETSVLLSKKPVQVFAAGVQGYTKVENLRQYSAVQHRLDTHLVSTGGEALVLSFKSARAYELSPELRPQGLL